MKKVPKYVLPKATVKFLYASMCFVVLIAITAFASPVPVTAIEPSSPTVEYPMASMIQAMTNSEMNNAAIPSETETTASETQNVATGPGMETTAEVIEQEVVAPVRTYSHYAVIEDGYTLTMPIEHQDYLYSLCEQYGLTDYYQLAMAIAFHESKFKSSVISRTSDYGYMQINKCNHKRLRKTLGINDFLNPHQNLAAGVYMMKECLDANGYDISRALVQYNTGRKGTSTKYSRCILNDINKFIVID